jgi:hypothetical protein
MMIALQSTAAVCNWDCTVEYLDRWPEMESVTYKYGANLPECCASYASTSYQLHQCCTYYRGIIITTQFAPFPVVSLDPPRRPESHPHPNTPLYSANGRLTAHSACDRHIAPALVLSPSKSHLIDSGIA